MMRYLENFLGSGYTFDEEENLQKFRFSLLNATIVTSFVFTLANYLMSWLEVYRMGSQYEAALLVYASTDLLSFFLLRYKKHYYVLVANIVIFSSLLLFCYTLVHMTMDELRIIWFFIVQLVGFVLLGKRYGLFLMTLILSLFSMLALSYPLGFSYFAYFTFYDTFILFTIFSSFFLTKIEQDAYEFKILNRKLQAKVSQEIAERKAQEKMLLQQCRLASMGEMIDSIAHQWRQPLMHINSVLMNMDREIELRHPSAYMEQKMSEIVDLTGHMSQTIEDFRYLFRKDKEMHAFDINESISKALSLFDYKTKNIQLTFTHASALTYTGHANEIIQVMLILLSNAFEMFLARDSATKHLHISTGRRNSQIFISVEDTAGGISPEHLEKIFDPYFTTKKSTGGTGLGLYIAKIIIETNNHGKLTASNTQKGALFTITLKEKK